MGSRNIINMKKEEVENYLHKKIEKGETVSPILPEGIKNYLIDIDGNGDVVGHTLIHTHTGGTADVDIRPLIDGGPR